MTVKSSLESNLTKNKPTSLFRQRGGKVFVYRGHLKISAPIMSQSVSNEPPKNVAPKEVGSTWSKNKGNVNIDLTNLGRPQQQTKAPSMNQLSGNSTPQASPAMTPMMGGMSPMMANPGLVLYKTKI